MCQPFFEKEMNKVLSYRFKNARKLRGLSQKYVADKLNISKQMISKYEKGNSIPNSTNLLKIAKIYDLNPDYFFTPLKYEIGEFNFRKKSTFKKKEEDSLKEIIRIKIENYLYIENCLSIDTKFYNPLKNRIIANYYDIVDAVEELKKQWEIGFDPIHNIIQMLEDKKLKIIEIENVNNAFDGLSTIIDNKYHVIVINKNFPVERKRFSLLHELGHIILNIKSDISSKEVERLCNQFASEMLISKKILIEEFGKKREHISYTELSAIQKKYGISIRAIMYKLLDAGVINSHYYKKFYIKLNSDSEFRDLIDKSLFETPEVSDHFSRLVYRAMTQEVISMSKAASLLGISVSDLRDNYRII